MEYTKTVWKDLPDTSTPITADRLNNIEDGVEYLFECCNNMAVDTTDVYSTDEVKTNKIWLGKNVYRKVYVGTYSSGSLVIEHGLTNVNFINAYGFVQRIDFSPLVNIYQNSNYNKGFIITSTQILVKSENTSSIASGSAYIVVEYTKTTD